MSNIEKTIQSAEQKCRSRGTKLTAKRKLVLSGLLLSDKAMSAYELMDYLRQEYDEAIPAMSIYRILEFLQNEQFAHKLNLANKFVACSHINCDHNHQVPQFLICSECQQVKEVTLSEITQHELKRNVEEAGFQLVSPQIEIDCICSECAAKAA